MDSSSIAEDGPSRQDRARLVAMSGFALPLAVGLVAELGVADVLAEGPLPVSDIAERCNAHEGALYRTLRFVASRGIFEEQPVRIFAVNGTAHFLRTGVDGSLRSAIRLNPTQMAMFTVMAESMHSLRTGEPCYERAIGMKLFDAVSSTLESNRRFNEQMKERSANIARDVLDAFDFDDIRAIVDVGGGTGMFLARILSRYPSMYGTLLELPNVAADAHELLEAEGVAGRVRVVPGDMFEAVPRGADAYVLSSVLHDWPDEDAVKVLRACRAAMTATSRVLVVETLMSDDPERSMAAKQLDFNMMLASGGRERTAAEFEDLFTEAALRLDRVHPTRGAFSVLEGAPLPGAGA